MGTVAAGHPLAASIGADMLRSGGSAFDAAAAAAYALMVVLPESCGIGGDALFLVKPRDGSVTAHIGSGMSPAGYTGPPAADGGQTTTVPGAVASLDAAHQRYGRLGRDVLFKPAVDLAVNGYPITQQGLAAVRRQRARLQRGAPGSPLLGTGLRPGDLVRVPALAASLQAISDSGAAAFYSGDIAHSMVRRLQADGSAMNLGDLEQHTDTVVPALATTRLGVHTFALPPMSQGILSLMALGVLSDVDDPNPAVRAHMGIEAAEAAFQHRPVIATDRWRELLDIRLQVHPGRAGKRGGPTQQTHTTAVAAADADGTVVSMVISLYDEFGSAAYAPDTGIFFNDRMLGFDADPASPNAPRPSAKPVHTLAPMMFDDGERCVALATPGADAQVQTLAQVMDHLVIGGLSSAAAIDVPRWRASDAVVLLEADADPQVRQGLVDWGHEVRDLPVRDRGTGAVVIAGHQRESGSTFGAADLRRDAAVAVC